MRKETTKDNWEEEWWKNKVDQIRKETIEGLIIKDNTFGLHQEDVNRYNFILKSFAKEVFNIEVK